MHMSMYPSPPVDVVGVGNPPYHTAPPHGTRIKLYIYYIVVIIIYNYVLYYIVNIYIYIWYPPRPTFEANLVVFTVSFLTFWTLQLRAFSGDQKLHFFAILFPPHPSLSTSDTRFKIQDSRLKLLESKEVGFKIQDTKKPSLIRGGRIQDSREKTVWIQGGRIQDSRSQKECLESKGVGFKIQDSRLRKEFLNPRG